MFFPFECSNCTYLFVVHLAAGSDCSQLLARISLAHAQGLVRAWELLSAWCFISKWISAWVGLEAKFEQTLVMNSSAAIQLDIQPFSVQSFRDLLELAFLRSLTLSYLGYFIYEITIRVYLTRLGIARYGQLRTIS